MERSTSRRRQRGTKAAATLDVRPQSSPDSVSQGNEDPRIQAALRVHREPETPRGLKQSGILNVYRGHHVPYGSFHLKTEASMRRKRPQRRGDASMRTSSNATTGRSSRTASTFPAPHNAWAQDRPTPPRASTRGQRRLPVDAHIETSTAAEQPEAHSFNDDNKHNKCLEMLRNLESRLERKDGYSDPRRDAARMIAKVRRSRRKGGEPCTACGDQSIVPRVPSLDAGGQAPLERGKARVRVNRGFLRSPLAYHEDDYAYLDYPERSPHRFLRSKGHLSSGNWAGASRGTSGQPRAANARPTLKLLLKDRFDVDLSEKEHVLFARGFQKFWRGRSASTLRHSCSSAMIDKASTPTTSDLDDFVKYLRGRSGYRRGLDQCSGNAPLPGAQENGPW